MKLVPIKDVITDKISGEWGDEAINGKGIVVIRTANFLNSGKINFSNLVRREVDNKKVTKKRLLSGDIIIEKSGGSPTQPVGRVVLFRSPDNDTYLCNNFTSILRPNKNEVHPEYLFYVLHNNHKNGRTLRHQNKTTGIINLKLDSYLDSEIPLPPLDDQIRIAHLLGKVEGLIAQRKQNLQQLDDLLKSVFLEMFGDPVRNEKGWKPDSLANFGTFKNGLNYGKGESGVQVRCLGVGDFKALSKITNVNCLPTITLDSEPPDDYMLRNGDLIFVRSNGNRDLVGRCIAIYPNEERVAFSGFCIRFRITEFSVDSTYITHLFRAASFRRSLLQGGQGANIQNINQKSLSELAIPIPPPELQRQFSSVVEKVEGIKSRYQQSLIDLEVLYGALSQHSFKGELDLSRVLWPGTKPEEEKAVVTEPLHAHAEQGLAINLPDTDNLLDALENAEARVALMAQWLEAYRVQLGNTPFSVQRFMTAAQTRLAELHPETDFELGANDYEHIKTWVFEALADGRLQQSRDITGHDENGAVIFGNLMEIKNGALP